MKKLMMLAVVFMMSAAACVAQNERGNRPDPTKQIEQMVKDLGLDADQTKKFKALQESQMAEMSKAFESGTRPSREEMEKSRAAMDTKVKAILTEEQYTKYQSLQKERGNRGGGRGQRQQ